MTQIYQTSFCMYCRYPKEAQGYEYDSQNPTRKALEDAYAAIENAGALAFGSGVAATDSVIKLLNPGDRSDCCQWHVWWRLPPVHQRVWERYGIKFKYVDTGNVRKRKSSRITSHQTHLGGNAPIHWWIYHGYCPPLLPWQVGPVPGFALNSVCFPVTYKTR